MTEDAEGLDLPDLGAARATAIVAARDVMGGELANGALCFSCHINIADADGHVLLAVAFKEAVRISGL